MYNLLILDEAKLHYEEILKRAAKERRHRELLKLVAKPEKRSAFFAWGRKNQPKTTLGQPALRTK
jgi:hypothetical protein